MKATKARSSNKEHGPTMGSGGGGRSVYIELAHLRHCNLIKHLQKKTTSFRQHKFKCMLHFFHFEKHKSTMQCMQCMCRCVHVHFRAGVCIYVRICFSQYYKYSRYLVSGRKFWRSKIAKDMLHFVESRLTHNGWGPHFQFGTTSRMTTRPLLDLSGPKVAISV